MIARLAPVVVLLLASSAAASPMPDGPLTNAPAGWTDYCRRHASEDIGCRQPIPALAVGLTPHRWGQLRATHRELLMIRQISDAARGLGNDHWETAIDSGDCEDIALAGRKRLVERGWPLGALRIVLALSETGTPHAVLAVDVVRDGRLDTLVLDSRFGQPMQWDRLVAFGYFFTKRQSSTSLDWSIVANGIGTDFHGPQP